MTRSLTHLLIALALLAASVGTYVMWYISVVRESDRALSLITEVERASDAAARASETKSVLASLAEDENSIRTHFVVASNISLFLEELETTGRSLGAVVEVISVADTLTKEERVNVSLRIVGTFDSVLRTLGAIEYGPYDTRLEHSTFDAKGTERGGVWTSFSQFSVGVVPTAIAPKNIPE